MTAKTTNVKIVRDETGVQIATYNRTNAALAELQGKYKGMIFEVTTTKGMKEAKAARKELKDLRVNLEKTRQELKAPVLEYTRALDGQAKDIKGRIEALEKPVDEQIQAEEARKAREKAEAEAAERKRIDAHRQVIEGMRNRPLALIGASADDIEDAFKEVQATDIEPLEEFKGEAALVRDEASGKLHDLLTQARANEEAAEREAAARREREEAEKKAEAEREEERQELARLRQFKADQEARDKAVQPAEENPSNKAFNDAVTHGSGVMSGGNHIPSETFYGVDMAAGKDETVTQELVGETQERDYIVHATWSGYSRGTAVYRVKAGSPEEAKELWTEGELVSKNVVREDIATEVDSVEPAS